MFRAQICQLANGPTLQMEGRLVGDWAEQVKALITKDSVPKRLIVDVTEVTYVDSVGDQVLKWLESIGAKFVAKEIYAAGTCERLQLPLLDTIQARAGHRSKATDQKV